MKAIVNSAEENKVRPFPKLMICTDECNPGMIIQFLRPEYGFVVKPGNGHDFDSDPDNWDMDSFVDFEGSVTLSND